MISSFFLKLAAREKLGKSYFRTVLGAAVQYIPQYLVSLAVAVLVLGNPIIGGAAGRIVTAVAGVLVFDIFGVGFMRSLLEIKPKESGGYNINLVLSGYRQNFGNTLKIVFFKRLYLFFYSLLVMLPIVIFGIAIGFMADNPAVAKLISMVTEFASSPTAAMVESIAVHMAENCMFVVYMLFGVYVLMLAAMIPYVRKIYEYAAIPMILAENSDISKKEAFAQTRKIMVGYRMRYFALQLSFMGIMILAWVVSAIFPAEIGYYIAWSFILPYMNMTLLQFYSERRRVLDGVDEQTEEKHTEERND